MELESSSVSYGGRRGTLRSSPIGRGSNTHCNSDRVPKSPKLREATDPFRRCNKNTASDLAGRPSVDSTLPVLYHSFVVPLSLYRSGTSRSSAFWRR